LADDRTNGVALLQLFGGARLAPAGLVHEGANGPALTLVGIADPQSQAGGHAISTATAHMKADLIEPAPQPGFAGAAVLDSRGRFLGMVDVKPVEDDAEHEANAKPKATLVSVGAIRKFLEARYVVPATGPAGVDAAKASVVRVICIRK
jgi:hypothetical protein